MPTRSRYLILAALSAALFVAQSVRAAATCGNVSESASTLVELSLRHRAVPFGTPPHCPSFLGDSSHPSIASMLPRIIGPLRLEKYLPPNLRGRRRRYKGSVQWGRYSRYLGDEQKPTIFLEGTWTYSNNAWNV